MPIISPEATHWIHDDNKYVTFMYYTLTMITKGFHTILWVYIFIFVLRCLYSFIFVTFQRQLDRLSVGIQFSTQLAPQELCSEDHKMTCYGSSSP
jgi:hypothetical protein